MGDENQELAPDIAEKMAVLQEQNKEVEVKDQESRPIPAPLELEKEKISFSHVKTPDEVDDLPEHEVVAHDIHIPAQQKEEAAGQEEKIALDVSEKELKDSSMKSDASIEAVRDNEIVEVAVEQRLLNTDALSQAESDNEVCIEKDELESNEKDDQNDIEVLQKIEKEANDTKEEKVKKAEITEPEE